MSQPKKRVSAKRRNQRRYSAANLLDTPTAVTCSNCNEPKRPHRICSCGFYDGKAVVAVREKAQVTT